jgi:hypothetical protein
MGTTADKLMAALNSKNAIKAKFNLPDDMPFSQYAENIKGGGGETAFYKCSSVSGTILYTVRGAGYKAANGGYWDSGETYSDGGNATPILTNGACFMRYGDMGMTWSIFDSYSNGTWGNELYYLEGESDPTMPWWFVSDVEEPAPVVSNGTSVSPITQIKVDGAGDTAYDGTYQIRNHINEGYERSWLNATNMGYIIYDPSTNTWVICMSLGPDDEPDTIFYRSSATAENPWDGKWTKVSGSGSAPTVQYLGADTEVGEPKQIWSGYKAVLVTETEPKTIKYYDFEKTLTTGLTYGYGFVPKVGNIYDAEAMIKANLSTAFPKPVFAEKFNGALSNNFTQLGEAPEYSNIDGRVAMKCDYDHRLSTSCDGFPSGNSPRTMSAWIYANSGFSREWNMYCGYGDLFSLRIYWGDLLVGGSGYPYIPMSAVTQNQWQHIVITFDGEKVIGYVNNQKSGEVACTMDTIIEGYNLCVGHEKDDGIRYSTDGYISDLQIYDTALIAEQVTELYQESQA